MRDDSYNEIRMENKRGGGTPLAVWAIYVLGTVGAVTLTLTLVGALGVLAVSESSSVQVEVSYTPAFFWGSLVVLAVTTWLLRRGVRR